MDLHENSDVTDFDLVERAINLEFPERLILRGELKRILGVTSDATLLAWEDQIPGFPRRRLIGPRRVGWLASEVLAFLRSRPVQRGRRPDEAIKKSVRVRAEAIEARSPLKPQT